MGPVGRILASAERWLSSYISTRMRRGVRGRRETGEPQSPRRARGQRLLDPDLPCQSTGWAQERALAPNRLSEYSVSNSQSSIDSNEYPAVPLQSLSSVPLSMRVSQDSRYVITWPCSTRLRTQQFPRSTLQRLLVGFSRALNPRLYLAPLHFVRRGRRLHGNRETRRRSGCVLGESASAELGHRERGCFVQRAGGYLDGVLDAVGIDERDAADTRSWHEKILSPWRRKSEYRELLWL
jgi:hypothetical protein